MAPQVASAACWKSILGVLVTLTARPTTYIYMDGKSNEAISRENYKIAACNEPRTINAFEVVSTSEVSC